MVIYSDTSNLTSSPFPPLHFSISSPFSPPCFSPCLSLSLLSQVAVEDTPAYVMELVAVEMKTTTTSLPVITPTGWHCPDAGVLGRNAVIRRARQRFDRNIRYTPVN